MVRCARRASIRRPSCTASMCPGQQSLFPPRSEFRDRRPKAAQRLRKSSGKEAQGPNDPNAQDARTVWAISPPYNGTAATSRETIIRDPSRTGTTSEESRTEPAQVLHQAMWQMTDGDQIAAEFRWHDGQSA